MSSAPSKHEDRDAILGVARRTAAFSAEEVDTVEELFQGYQASPEKSGYNFITYREGDRVLGFACWGPTPLSKGTIDLYWICVAEEAQGKGAGAELFRAVTEAGRAAGRWHMVIWTSSKPEYEPARRFYGRMGCTLATRLADFYDHGDDLCVYSYRFD